MYIPLVKLKYPLRQGEQGGIAVFLQPGHAIVRAKAPHGLGRYGRLDVIMLQHLVQRHGLVDKRQHNFAVNKGKLVYGAHISHYIL